MRKLDDVAYVCPVCNVFYSAGEAFGCDWECVICGVELNPVVAANFEIAEDFELKIDLVSDDMVRPAECADGIVAMRARVYVAEQSRPIKNMLKNMGLKMTMKRVRIFTGAPWRYRRQSDVIPCRYPKRG